VWLSWYQKVPVVVWDMRGVDPEEFNEMHQARMSAINDLGEAFQEWARVVAERLKPAIDAFMHQICLIHRRLGLYSNLARWLGFSRWNWWLAWHLPDWVILRLPWPLVRWRWDDDD